MSDWALVLYLVVWPSLYNPEKIEIKRYELKTYTSVAACTFVAEAFKLQANSTGWVACERR